MIGRLAAAVVEGFKNCGPYSDSAAYFNAVADAAIVKLKITDTIMPWVALGAFVFQDIVQNTALYSDSDPLFPLNHMDLGTQNILIDDEFNFLAIIDWEFAQTSPWQINHFPMPFPLVESDNEIRSILEDPDHIAHENVARQEAARRLYVQKFRDAEAGLQQQGRRLGGSFADVLDSPPSRVFAYFTTLGRLEMADEGLVHEMVRLAFGFEGERVEEYLRRTEEKARQAAGCSAAPDAGDA